MIANLIAGHWCQPHTPALPVYNPATEDVLDEVPLSGPAEVTQAVAAAAEAYIGWSQTPVMERTRLMFRYKALLEEHGEELAALVTRHHGKTLDEAWQVLDEARDAMAERRLVNRATDVPFGRITFSGGIADVFAHASGREALKAADDALYAAKAAGRNCIVREGKPIRAAA